MKLHKAVQGIDSDDLRGYPAHWVDDEWGAFASKHQRWLEGLEEAEPLYCLPEKAISSLARSRRAKSRLLDTRAAEAEMDLAKICRRVRAVGFSEGRFIHYPFLADPPGDSSERAPTTERNRLTWDLTQDEAILERLRGYAGRLVSDPHFLADVAQLNSRWRTFPQDRRPILPLARFICANDYHVLSFAGTPEQKDFEEDFRVYCDRWLLAGMATWELPVPRGPVLPGENRTTLEVYPEGMLTVVVPFYYPLPGDDSLLWKIYSRQRVEAQRKGLDPDLAGLTHYKAYGHMLVVAHLESVIMNRYGRGRHKWGLVGQVEDALHGVLGVGKDQIKKLRKAISACRRGKRATLQWLRPRRR